MKPEDEFIEEVMAEFGPIQQFEPCAYYDENGDCIEFMLTQEPFRGERIDNWVTVYYGEQTGDMTGGLIKDIQKLMHRFPGLDIEIEDGQVRVAWILRASAWAHGDLVTKKLYKAVIQRAEEAGVVAEYQAA
jgi:hypothetical protein